MALALSPELADDEARLDGLAQPDLIGENDPARQGRAESEQRGVEMVGVQVHRSPQQ